MKLLVTGALLTASVLFAQFDTADVLGTVHDKSGSVLPKVRLTLLNQDTGIQAKTISDDNGNYDFFNVKVGRYTVTAQLEGFSQFSTSDVIVNVNARQRVDVTMDVGVVTETVEVKGAAAALETDSSERGQVIAQQALQLPLNGRSYADLALLTTNIHRSPITISTTPREGAFNVNGLRSTYNNFLLDGLDNNAYSTSNQGFSNQVAQPSPDALAEFKVIVGNYSAEYGRVGGAVVNVAMRSGTNQLHGTAYEFLRNTDLNAVGYIFGQRSATFAKPALHRNQFGVTVGGPIVRNKLFFFGDYEGFRQIQSFLAYDTIPTLNDRQGILPVEVVNPLTGADYPAGAKIPATSFAAQVLSALPAPSSGTARANDYQFLNLTRDYGDKYDAKIDGQINSKMNAFLRFSQRKDNQFFAPDLPGPSGGNGNGFVRVLQQNAAFSYTWVATPSSLLDVRLGFSHILGGKFPVYLGGASFLSTYGIPGLSTAPNLTGGLNTQNVGGFNGFGRQATNPQFQNPTSWDPKVNYSWMKGRHALKIGAEMQIIHTEVMDINPVYGLTAYSGQFSNPCAAPATRTGCAADATSYNLADFMFGLPSQEQLANYLIGNYRQRVYNLYAQDDFRVNSKLTVNIGFRWEFATPRWERDNVLSNFNPASNSMITAKNGGLYDRTLVNPDYKDFAPRIGAAYSIDPKTVVRGGYGISYVHLNRLGSADELGINGPQVYISTVNQSPLLANGQRNPAFLTTQEGFPTATFSPSAFNPVLANVAYIPADTRWPYIQTWFLAVQRELVKNTVLEVTYSGNHGLRLPILADYNQAVANQPGQSLGIQPRRPDQGFGAITWVDPAGSQNYNGFSARLEHRFSAGLYFLNSFTWSKSLGNTEQALEYASGYYQANPQNIYNLKAERGLSSFDVKFINVTSVVYDLPFGKGRKFGSGWNPVIDGALGGWELNTINTANTGIPIDITYAPTAANDVTGRIPDYRGEALMRPNLVGNPAGATGPAKLDHYYNAAAFSTPVASAPFGTVGRNSLRAPGLAQWDLGVNKNFRIPFREGLALQFRSEFFNVLNHSNFGQPDANFSGATFGTIRSTLPARQIQFALKLMF